MPLSPATALLGLLGLLAVGSSACPVVRLECCFGGETLLAAYAPGSGHLCIIDTH